MTRQSALRTMRFHPNVDHYGGSAVTQSDGGWERSRFEGTRFEWRVGDSGDPASLVSDFLGRHGLGLPGRTRAVDGVIGASLHISAAAGAAMIDGAAGAPSPCPAVPDVVAVIYKDPAAFVNPVSVDPAVPANPPHLVAPASASTSGSGWAVGAWEPSWSVAAHRDAVRRVRAAIARGDVYQVNVVGHASAPYRGDPLPALRRLAGLRGATYGGILTGPGWALATASPELLVRVEGDVVETRPIKGTRPATPAGRRELLGSAKERAEHVMIVDLARNDLSRLAGTGPVTVDELFAVRRWCGLWQAESVVSAPLTGPLDLAGLLRAVAPGGSVTGAPKLAALAEIARLEPVGRGAGMGVLGWVAPDHVDLGLTIRTVVADGERLHVWAGGGITIDSDPAAEVAEAAAKAAPVRAALSGRRPGGAR
jgi:para-aminobenzoate synthetase component 1